MALDCPRCPEVKLDEIEVGDILVDRCPRCAGIWFDHDEMGRLTGRRDGLAKLESVVPPPQHAVTVMRCPRCPDVPLRRLESIGQGGKPAVVYRCVSCAGTWLDRGELRDIEDPRLPDTLTRYLNSMFPQ